MFEQRKIVKTFAKLSRNTSDEISINQFLFSPFFMKTEKSRGSLDFYDVIMNF